MACASRDALPRRCDPVGARFARITGLGWPARIAGVPHPDDNSPDPPIVRRIPTPLSARASPALAMLAKTIESPSCFALMVAEDDTAPPEHTLVNEAAARRTVEAMMSAGTRATASPAKSGRRQSTNRQGETAAADPPTELLPRSGQSTSNRSDRHLKYGRSLAIAFALEIAEHDSNAKRFRQAVHFLMDQPPQLFALRVAFNSRLCNGEQLCSECFTTATPRGFSASPPRRAESHPMQPRTERIRSANRTGPARQNEKRSLESVFGVVLVSQDPLTRGQHHGSVATDELFKRNRRDAAVRRDNPVQKFPVRQTRQGPRPKERVELPNGCTHPTLCHGFAPLRCLMNASTWESRSISEKFHLSVNPLP